MQKLTGKDIRALKIGGICAVGIVAFLFGARWLESWSNARAEVKMRQAQIDDINLSGNKQAGLLSLVPAFEMPAKEEDQKNKFREKLVDQLKSAGINTEPLKVVTSRKTLYKNYMLMSIQCKGKCKFTQVLDLLAKLNENPYLVGIEAFKIKCDKNNPQDVELDMTVSTVYLPG
ncbi:MAG: hypothetical protein JXN61_15450 [Sedimentisphaerales bacterium]|nr:hypothetical protein [Sedimentisphaerales bacterium]